MLQLFFLSLNNEDTKMRKENASFNTKFISESGSYLHNSDYFAFVELRDYACYVIADGIDTDEKKESAKLAITTVITKFSENPGMSGTKLKKYMNAAHKTLLGEADEIRLEVSILILVTDYKKVMWAHAGNCRLYWMRNGKIHGFTKDTSLSQKLADEEEVPLDQLAYHEERNNLYAYLGQPGRFTPIISGKKKLDDGDIFILVTRGVWENVGEAEIIDSVEGVSKPEEVCTGLEDVILSQRLSVVENYTISSVFVDKTYKNPKAGKYKKLLKIVISIATALLMLVLGMLIMQHQKNKTNILQMGKNKDKGIEYLNENNYISANEKFKEAYNLSEVINAREKSDIYQDILCVQRYEKLSENLKNASAALGEKEYKKALGLYSSSLESVKVLRDEYGQDVSGYIEDIQAYYTYSEAMKDGQASYEKKDFDDAILKYANAGNIMDEIDDTANRNIADEALKNSNTQKALKNGAEYEQKGDNLLEEGVYSQALTQYQSARDMYLLAKEDYGSLDANDKISMVDIKIQNVQDMMNKLSNQDLEKEADGYMEMASQAAHDGDYEKAQEYYEDAKEIFQQTGNTDQIISINDKIDGIQYGPEEDAAIAGLVSALDALSKGDNTSAIVFLKQTMEIYNELGDIANANQIQTIINNLGTVPEVIE